MPREKVINLAVLVVIIIAALGFSLYVSQIGALPQASYALLPHLAAPVASDRILVLSPHQDDEALGAGGYLYDATKAGATIEIAFATDGNKHGLKEQRKTEAQNAEAALGIASNQLVFFDFPDSRLKENQAALTARLATEIANFKPTVVLTTLPEDDNPDHQATGVAVQTLAESNPSFQADYFLIHYDRYPRPIGSHPQAYLLPPTELVTPDYNWLVFDLSSQEAAAKTMAVAAYKTQLSMRNPILRQLLFSFERRNELFVQIR